MTNHLTDKSVKALLQVHGGYWGQATVNDLARALLDALAELAQSRAEHAASLIRINAEAVEAVAQARADTQAAVALAVERAEQTVLTRASGVDDDLRSVLAADIRALSPADGLAAVEALRKERDDALAEVARFQEDRAYVIGANDGWDAAVEQGEASPAVGKAMTQFWKRMAETHNRRAEKAEAELAAAQQREAEWHDGSRPLPFDRDTVGRMVREAWVRWAKTQPSPKPSWLVPYDDLNEADKEADRQIGEAVARWTLAFDAARAAAQQREARRSFPILKGEGAKIDYQLVADHAEQARSNHGQSVNQLAARGGLSWCELYAVLHNRKWEKVDTNEAMIACRALEARYLAALASRPDGGEAPEIGKVKP